MFQTMYVSLCRKQLPQASVNGKTSTTEAFSSDKTSASEAYAQPAADSSSVAKDTQDASKGIKRKNRPPTPAVVSTPALGVSGPYITTASMDGDAFLGTDLIKRELVEPYRLTKSQVRVASSGSFHAAMLSDLGLLGC